VEEEVGGRIRNVTLNLSKHDGNTLLRRSEETPVSKVKLLSHFGVPALFIFSSNNQDSCANALLRG
jgi:hypothetical protein